MVINESETADDFGLMQMTSRPWICWK